MNGPCLHNTPGIGHTNRSDVHASSERLVGQREVGERFVDGDLNRNTRASTAVVGVNRVRRRRLVGGRAARDGPVGEHQVPWEGWMNAPCLNQAAGVRNHNRPNINTSREDLIGE